MAVYTIKNKTYGKALVGTKIYYRGFGNKRPKFLKDKGQGFAGGKHLLETLNEKFKRYDLVLTPKADSITTAAADGPLAKSPSRYSAANVVRIGEREFRAQRRMPQIPLQERQTRRGE